MKISDILGGTKKRLNRNSRKRRQIQPDSLYRITGKDLTENADARIQHLEDLVIWNGSQGIKKAIDSLHQLENNPSNITIKWDGSPAIIFGRNQQGDFILTDKSGFGASGYNGRVTNPDDLESMFMNRKLKDPSPEKVEDRKKFAARMKNIWDTVEAAVPKDFVGYVYGDLLYYTTPIMQNNAYTFTPNTTTYIVDKDSQIGQSISQSKTGVVLHGSMDLQGQKQADRSSELISGDLLVLPPVSISKIEELDIQGLTELKAFANRYGSAIDDVLNIPAELKISDFGKLIYAYTNSKAKQQSMKDFGVSDFAKWITQSGKVSKPKQGRIIDWISANSTGISALFNSMLAIMSIKNDAIRVLDSQKAEIQAYTAGQPGGEGYVVGKDVKLVNRLGFSAANFNKER